MIREIVNSSELALDIMPEEHRQNWADAKKSVVARALVGCARVAFSYRNFKVGCSAFSYNESKREYFTAQSGNYKAQPGTQETAKKLCAERFIIESAESNGDSAIIGLVVASVQTQPELATGLSSDVLCPCAECRKMFTESSLIKPWTRILLLKLKEEIGDLGMVEFYEKLGRMKYPDQTSGLIEITKEMSYIEFMNRIKQGRV